MREREVVLALLASLPEQTTLPESVGNLSSLLQRARTNEAVQPALTLTDPELEVLSRLARQRQDKQIATELGLIVDGVRARIRSAPPGTRARPQRGAGGDERHRHQVPPRGRPQRPPRGDDRA